MISLSKDLGRNEAWLDSTKIFKKIFSNSDRIGY